MRMMVRLTLAVAVTLCSIATTFAFPHALNYQGVLRDAGGIAVADGNHSVTVRFYDAATGGNILWEETQSITTVSGHFSALLGSTTPIPEAVFENDAWMGVTVEADPEMAPRTEVASVGYAYHAINADKLQGMGPNELVWPSTPAQVFRAYRYGDGVLFGPTGRVRQITGIQVYGDACYIKVNGVEIMFGGSWNSCSGAPIQIEPTDVVEIVGATSYVTVTGFEY